LDVVLIENASEIVSQMKNTHGFIEQIFDFILEDNKKGYKFLGSYNFPESVAGIEKKAKSLKREHDMSAKKLILHVSLDLGDVGHYGIIIRNGNTVIVFDSMQATDKDSEHSYYTPKFKLIAKALFGINPIVPNIRGCESLQPTGGFVEEKKSDKGWFYAVQNADSQNHFCYMWAIWWCHLFIIGGKRATDKAIKSIYRRKILPLVVIKRYIWALLNSFYTSNKDLTDLFKEVIGQKVPDRDIHRILAFFMVHFRYIWDDLDTKDVKKFNRYAIIDCDLNEVRNMGSTNDCLDYSLRKPPYEVDDFCSGRVVVARKSKKKGKKRR